MLDLGAIFTKAGSLEAAAILVAATLAFLGYFVAHMSAARLRRRDAELDFLQAQLRDLYGPLYALTQSNSRTWAAFRSTFRPGRSIFSGGEALSDDELKTWAFWISNVFQPCNRRMRTVIERNAHLIVEDSLPQCVLDFQAHADLFEAVVESWRSGNFDTACTAIPYPKELDEYVKRTYLQVSRRHAKLAGRQWRR